MKITKSKSQFLPRAAALMLAVIASSILFAVTVSADIGPKPSVTVKFENADGAEVYATLLSEYPDNGPWSVWDGEDAHANHRGNYSNNGDPSIPTEEIWRAFVDYADTNGFSFLQRAWRVDETKQFSWTYYPPSTFKVLIYYPESGTFAVSEVEERYAFDSYFTAKIDGETVSLKRSYEYKNEIISLLARIVFTAAVEIAIALLFGYRRKRQVCLIAAVNVSTQILLNVLLNLINYKSGNWAFVFYYIVLELAVTVVESVIYACCLHRLTSNGDREPKKARAIVYAIVSNAVSFAVGIITRRRVLSRIFRKIV